MWKTLHVKLLISFLIVSLIPILVVGWLSYCSQKQTLTKQIEQNMALMTDNLSYKINDFIAERISDVKFITNDPIVRNRETTKMEIKEELESFIQTNPMYFGAIFVNQSGKVTTDTDNTVIGKDFYNRVWFQSALKGNFYFSDIFMSPALKKPMLVIAGPVKDSKGNTFGVVSPSFDLEQFLTMIDRFATNKKMFPQSSQAFLINSKGEIIGHSDRSKILKENFLESNEWSIQQLHNLINQKKTFLSKDQTKVHFISPIAKTHGFDQQWYIGVSIKKEELYAPLRSLIVRYLVIFIVLLITIAYAVIKLSTYILKPVDHLVEVIYAYSIGKPAPVFNINTYNEIKILHSTFEQMIEKLEKREEEHKKSTLILESTDNGVLCFCKKTGTITNFNKQCESVFKIDKEQAIGKTLAEVSQLSTAFKSFMDTLPLEEVSSLSEIPSKSEIECTIEDKEYNFFINISNISSIEHDEKGNEVLLLFSDVTEKRQMENEINRIEQLKVVDHLAAGFAHEIRNPLTTIRGFLQLFKENTTTGHLMEKKYLDTIIYEVDRVNHLVTDFLTLSKPSKNHILTKDIDLILEDILILIESQLLYKNISLVTQLTPLPRVPFDSHKLKQVFLNLIQNAIDAMPTGGTLSITTNFIEKSNEISILFTDTGIGMDTETLNRLGTPFYTTKGTGTGLGIMMCYRIIEKMEGSIDVESKLGMGTSFFIRLPIVNPVANDENLNGMKQSLSLFP